MSLLEFICELYGQSIECLINISVYWNKYGNMDFLGPKYVREIKVAFLYCVHLISILGMKLKSKTHICLEQE